MAANSPAAVTIGNVLFRFRSYIPIPFFIAVVVFAQLDPLLLAAGIFITICGEILRFLGVGHAGYATRTTTVGANQLVTAGPFARMRNPLYVGNILLGLGFVIGAGGLFPWLPSGFLIFTTIYYYFIIRAEESFLSEKFGSSYQDYLAHVPRFFPRLTPWKGSSQHPMEFKVAWRSERRTFQTIIIMAFLISLSMIAKTYWISCKI